MSIEVQLEEIKYFLLKVHPYLENPNNTECIEIRPISREKDYDFKLSKPLNIWKIDDKSIDLLRNFLEIHKDKYYCLYYSIFNFDYEAPTKRKGYITSSTVGFTEEIVIDFDNINENTFLDYKNKLEKIGIYGL